MSSDEHASGQAAPAPPATIAGPPLRLQVDLSLPPEARPGGRCAEPWFGSAASREIIGAIIGATPLMLQIGYPPPGAGASDLLREFVLAGGGAGMAVSLVLDAGTPAAGRPIPGGIREVALDLFGLRGDEQAMRRALEDFVAPEGVRRGALMRLSRETLPHLASFVRAAAAAGVDFIELPPPALLFHPPDGRRGHVLEAGDYRRAEEILRGIDAASIPADLRIHDVMLDRLVAGLPGRRPAAGPGFGGCQAAAALAYIAPDGIIHPCIALDLPLGSVRDLAAAPPWNGPAAREVRARVAAATPDCGGCGAWRVCRGGCPASRLALTATWTDDPLCDTMIRSMPPPGAGAKAP